jgi:hypothetical protein
MRGIFWWFNPIEIVYVVSKNNCYFSNVCLVYVFVSVFEGMFKNPKVNEVGREKNDFEPLCSNGIMSLRD